MALATYCESVVNVTLQGTLSACNADMTAVSSMRLLVVFLSPPPSSFSCSPKRNTAPQPPGPGLPEQAPSVKISTLGLLLMGIVYHLSIDYASLF